MSVDRQVGERKARLGVELRPWSPVLMPEDVTNAHVHNHAGVTYCVWRRSQTSLLVAQCGSGLEGVLQSYKGAER